MVGVDVVHNTHRSEGFIPTFYCQLYGSSDADQVVELAIQRKTQDGRLLCSHNRVLLSEAYFCGARCMITVRISVLLLCLLKKFLHKFGKTWVSRGRPGLQV
jgi:hypothetical protein